MKRHRSDNNTDDICKALDRCGVPYRRVGHCLDFCDLLVKSRKKGIIAVEVKSENDSPLTIAEEKFLKQFGDCVVVAYDVQDILERI